MILFCVGIHYNIQYFSGVYPICIPSGNKRGKVERKRRNINFSSLKTVLNDNNECIKLACTTYAPGLDVYNHRG